MTSLLKLLRKKKSFYYKPGNFTAVSGMLYRMKQNGVGLASISILSTMVPPSLLQESQARRAAMMLPACMRPEGVGAKRPCVTFSSMSLLPVQMLR